MQGEVSEYSGLDTQKSSYEPAFPLDNTGHSAMAFTVVLTIPLKDTHKTGLGERLQKRQEQRDQCVQSEEGPRKGPTDSVSFM